MSERFARLVTWSCASLRLEETEETVHGDGNEPLRATIGPIE